MSRRRLRVEKLETLARNAKFQPGKMAILWPISVRQMERIFQHEFQKSPRLWLRELQCRLAKELISQGYSNKSVTAELWFGSETHFCREFKKAFGSPPQSFTFRAFERGQNVVD